MLEVAPCLELTPLRIVTKKKDIYTKEDRQKGESPMEVAEIYGEEGDGSKRYGYGGEK